MKKLLMCFVILSILIAGCKKQEDTVLDDPVSGEGEIVFTGETVEIDQLKSGQDADEFAEYAEIDIKDANNVVTTYFPDVYYIEKKAYTQALKLPPGTYTITKFLLIDDNQTLHTTSDDVVIYSIPMAGSTMAEYIDDGLALEKTFTIEAFKKEELFLQVLRFEKSNYQDFGFEWFELEQSVIYQHCFFGDLCVKDTNLYVGSDYEKQSTGLQRDMPAIAKIEVRHKKHGSSTFETTGTWTNNIDTSNYGVGEPLCILYEDYLFYVDTFQVVLSILVADGETFSFKEFKTWEFTDETAMDSLNPGDDGVTDYVLGSCVQEADFFLPPYMNLPPTVTYKGLSPYAPGSLNGYVDAEIHIQNDPGVYDFKDGTYASWCFEYDNTISINTTYDMNVYSSLYPFVEWGMPPYLTEKEWDRANWLMNHLYLYDGYEWDDVQAALWLIEGWNGTSVPGGSGMSAASALAETMAEDAEDYGDGFVPLPGGYAAVIFANSDQIQTVFIVVDP